MNAAETHAAQLIFTAVIDNYNVAGEIAPLVTTTVNIDGVDIELETFNRRGIEVYQGEETLGYYEDLSLSNPALSAKLHRAVQQHMRKLYATFRASWKCYAARDVVVTVHGPGEISVDYVDGCDGERRGCSHLMTLARVEISAMHWVTWTLIMPGGTREQRKGWLHADFDGESSVKRDAAEHARRRQACDEHPRSRELSWSVYETSLEYSKRFGDAPLEQPAFVRPTAAEIAAAPL